MWLWDEAERYVSQRSIISMKNHMPVIRPDESTDPLDKGGRAALNLHDGTKDTSTSN